MQEIDARGLPVYRGPEVTLEGILSRKERLAGKLNVAKDRPLVVYAKNEFDIRNIKGPLLLRQLGFSKIYVLEGGFAEWAHYASIFPNNFPLHRPLQKGWSPKVRAFKRTGAKPAKSDNKDNED